ncbi:transposase [Flavobacterium oreochromis]
MLFPEDIGKYLSLDETSLSNGELYTVLTNKTAKGKKGTIVVMIAGTKAETVIEIINKIPLRARNLVCEITLDMVGNMGLIAKRCFSKATLVTDRFHVQKLAIEALQEIRIKYRWQAIDQENEAIEKSKICKEKYQPIILSNGDTFKQLLARSRYFLYKNKSKWSQNQKQRATILFQYYPDIEKAYNLTQDLREIFNKTTDKVVAYTKLAKWHEKVNQSGFKSFNIISKTIENHYQTILNYFDNRSANASAESFNAKIKAFRAQFRGVRSIEFFLFRLTKIYA